MLTESIYICFPYVSKLNKQITTMLLSMTEHMLSIRNVM